MTSAKTLQDDEYLVELEEAQEEELN